MGLCQFVSNDYAASISRGALPASVVFIRRWKLYLWDNSSVLFSMATEMTESERPQIVNATICSQEKICAEHYRIILDVPGFPKALPGQFVQIGNPATTPESSDTVPFLPRALSIGGQKLTDEVSQLEIIFRVVGVGTKWLSSLRAGEEIRVVGPLGNPFPVSECKSKAILVIGGVGLPPLRWFAEHLHEEGKEAIAFLGAQRSELIPLHMKGGPEPSSDATVANMCSAEFGAACTPLVISTDDGSCGFHGNVVEALRSYVSANGIDAEQTVVYTCGPDRMMQAVNEFCSEHSLECYVSLERPMACGVGTCQSCIVTVKSDRHESGKRYALCCNDGPVFPGDQIVWDDGHQGI